LLASVNYPEEPRRAPDVTVRTAAKEYP
jgi:hypothetical protein